MKEIRADRNLLVTVPIFNQPKWTEGIIEELALKTFSWATFLFVDDASTDQKTLELLDGFKFRWNGLVFRNDENRGVAHSWNRAIDFAKQNGFKHIAFLNNDIKLPHHWDNLLLEALGSPDVFLSSFCDTDNYWHGYWFMVKTQLFDELGKFSEEFGKYGGEDTDLMLKMKAGGYGWKNVPTKGLSDIGHYGSASAAEIFKTPEERWQHHDKVVMKIQEKWKKVPEHH